MIRNPTEPYAPGMRRDLSLLADRSFDLLVVGGGIHGACIAWDATLRGLSVALVDAGDFGAATSANSLRIVHGGLRYLARGDLRRMLESIQERTALLRIAPDLVEPLPVLVPTYRRPPIRTRSAYRLALAANDLISRHRNTDLEPPSFIPAGRILTRAECLQQFPWFPPEELTGGALWFDARIVAPERLTLSFVCSATRRGAVAANYVAVERLLVRDRAVHGAVLTDRLEGASLEVRSRAVVVAAGPWTEDLIACTLGEATPGPAVGHALGLNVVIQRKLADVAVGVQAQGGPREDPVCGGNRFLFLTPQAEATLLGTWYRESRGATELVSQRERGVRHLVAELNQACSGLDLSARDVVGYQWGWLPLKRHDEPGTAGELAERARVVDHGSRHHVRHLLSVEGVKYTTARAVAERVVNWVFRDQGQSSPPCRTRVVRLEVPSGMQTGAAGDAIAPGDIRRAIHDEMAIKLSDILRRTTTRTVPPPRSVLAEIARTAGAQLGWTSQREESEIDDVLRQSAVPHALMESVG